MRVFIAHIAKFSVLLMMFAAGVSWWLAPEPQPRPRAQAGEEAWKLPVVSRSDSERAIAAIVAANLWGSVQTSAEASLNDPDWRFSGVTVSGQEKLVLLAIDGQPMRPLKAGDELPGGAKILKINNDHLCLLINGKKRKLDLFL